MSIRSELVIKREDGKSIKIEVCAWIDRGSLLYDTTVYYRWKGKRKWIPALDTDDYRYRCSEDRVAYKQAQEMKHVLNVEIIAAKLKLYSEIKPTEDQS